VRKPTARVVPKGKRVSPKSKNKDKISNDKREKMKNKTTP